MAATIAEADIEALEDADAHASAEIATNDIAHADSIADADTTQMPLQL